MTIQPTEADTIRANFCCCARIDRGWWVRSIDVEIKPPIRQEVFFLRMVRMIELKGEGIECLTRKISNR